MAPFHRVQGSVLSWKVNHFHVAHYLTEMPGVIAQLSIGMEKAEEGRQSKTHRANKWCAEHTAWKPLALLMSGHRLGKRRGRGKQARMATSVNSLLVDILIVFSGLKYIMHINKTTIWCVVFFWHMFIFLQEQFCFDLVQNFAKSRLVRLNNRLLCGFRNKFGHAKMQR